MGPRALLVPFRHRDFRLLFSAQLASELGDWGARLALSILIYDRTGSAGLAGLVVVASFLPWAIAGPALSTLGDRFPRRTVMLVSDVVRGVLFCGLLLDLPVGALLALVLAASFATPPYDAAKSATLVDALPDTDTYGAGVTVCGITADAGVVVGYAFGGLLIAGLGLDGAIAVNVATFFVSAELTRRLGVGRVVPEREERSSRLLAGARRIRADRFVWRAAWVGITTSAAGIAIQTLLPVAAADALGAEDGSVGLLAAAMAVATGVCGFVLPHAGDHRRLLRWQAGICVAGGFGSATAFALWGTWPGLLVPVAVAGLIFGSFIPGMPVVGARLPGEIRSSAFGVLQGSTFAVQVAAAGAAGVAADAFGTRAVFVAAGAAAGILGLAGLALPVRAPADAGTGEVAVDAQPAAA